MGSGKTTQGKKLAPLLNLEFIDLDHYIVERENKSIELLFEEEGEKGFRDKETNYLEEILKKTEPTVVSLGGGTICFNDNIDLVKNRGFLVYIELPASVLADRLVKAKQTRPLFKGIPPEEIPQKISELLNHRLVYYRQADLIVNGLNLTPKYLYQKIVEFRKK